MTKPCAPEGALTTRCSGTRKENKNLTTKQESRYNRHHPPFSYLNNVIFSINSRTKSFPVQFPSPSFSLMSQVPLSMSSQPDGGRSRRAPPSGRPSRTPLYLPHLVFSLRTHFFDASASQLSHLISSSAAHCLLPLPSTSFEVGPYQMTPLSYHRIFYMMGLKHSPRFIHAFKLLGASFGHSMVEIFQDLPHLPPPKAYTGAHKDILDTFCIDLIYQVKEIILATTSPSNPLL